MSQMSRETFVSITREMDWFDPEEAIAQLDEMEFWSPEFVAKALVSAKKAYVRRATKTIKDENGWPVFASVVTEDAEGEEHRVYKQEQMFNADDYYHVSNYHMELAEHHLIMATGYQDRAKARLGMHIQLSIPQIFKHFINSETVSA